MRIEAKPNDNKTDVDLYLLDAWNELDGIREVTFQLSSKQALQLIHELAAAMKTQLEQVELDGLEENEDDE